jgi:hypothetical protein
MDIEFCAIIISLSAIIFWVSVYYIDEYRRLAYFTSFTSYILVIIISVKLGSETAYRKSAFDKNPYKTEIQYKQVKDSVFIPVDTILIRK